MVAEHDKRFDPGDGFPPLLRYRKLEQGDAVLSFYRAYQPINVLKSPESTPAIAPLFQESVAAFRKSWHFR